MCFINHDVIKKKKTVAMTGNTRSPIPNNIVFVGSSTEKSATVSTPVRPIFSQKGMEELIIVEIMEVLAQTIKYTPIVENIPNLSNGRILERETDK